MFGVFFGFNFFGKVMVELDTKLVFVKLLFWDFRGVELWRYMEVILVIGMENGGWKE